MKNHKGSVAALLTLGLVIIGSLVTIGISYLTTTNKIANNPRAASDACDDPDNSCWIVKCYEGAPNYSQYSPSLCQYDMPKSSCPDGGKSPYAGGGVMAYGVSSRDSYLADLKSQGCNADNTGDDNIGGGGGACDYASETKCHNAGCPKDKCSQSGCAGVTWKCTVKIDIPKNCDERTNCFDKFGAEVDGLSSEVLISIDNTASVFYKSGQCAEGTQVSRLNDLIKYCISESKKLSSVTCIDNLICKDNKDYKKNGNDNKYAYSIEGGVTTYYKGETCYGTEPTNKAGLTKYCTEVAPDPDAEENATCHKDVSCTALPGVTANNITNKEAKASYKIVNTDNFYYENTDCGGIKSNDIVSYCNNQPGVTYRGDNFTGTQKIYNKTTYNDCRDPQYLSGWNPTKKKYEEGVSEQDCINFFGEDPKPEMYKTNGYFYCCREIIK